VQTSTWWSSSRKPVRMLLRMLHHPPAPQLHPTPPDATRRQRRRRGRCQVTETPNRRALEEHIPCGFPSPRYRGLVQQSTPLPATQPAKPAQAAQPTSPTSHTASPASPASPAKPAQRAQPVQPWLMILVEYFFRVDLNGFTTSTPPVVSKAFRRTEHDVRTWAFS
jgi:hypothetical protein